MRGIFRRLGGGGRFFKNFDRFVEGISLDGRQAGFTNGLDHVRLGLQLRRGGAGHVEDVLLDDRAVDVVRAVTQRHLSQLQAEAHPIGGDVGEIVEVDAADGDGAQRIITGRRMFDGNVVVLRLIGERNERGEAVRLVLQRAQLPQMIHAVGERFDMAVEHGAGAALAQTVPGAVDIQIFLGGFFSLGDLRADFLAENFRAAPGERVQAGGLQFGERFQNGFLGEPGEV